MLNLCTVCGCLEGINGTGVTPTVEQAVMEGFILGVVAQRALASVNANVSGNLCVRHLAYAKASAGVAAEKVPKLAPFCNFGLTVVK